MIRDSYLCAVPTRIMPALGIRRKPDRILNMVIELPPEIESRLRGAASRSGMDVGAYAAKLIVEHVPIAHAVDDPTENDDVRPPRGFMPVQLERKSLFTQNVAAECKDLPKWKPHVDLSRHLLSEVDDG